ncbi:MAG: xanthine dehydrogenase molybdopterin binding subunit [Anaeromyxobacter sp.]|nr:xanthine dehydrogenase molybdopterin binding subunit [Anaeromyxobacter sp.]MBL0277750.1 xanthine dehydrogenase molybdopterin binding subunit [Anaeromyxobacter sp.]
MAASRPHDSAEHHVRGAARYVDDLPEPRGLLHAFVALSARAHARVDRLDVGPVRAAPGVAAVLTAADLAHGNDVGPVLPGDPIFADGLVEYWGQSLFAVAAETGDQARAAAGAAVVEYQDLPPILTVEEALAAGSFVLPTEVLRRGASAAALARAPRRLAGRFAMGGQEHFYLEGQVAMAVPGEGGTMLVHASTQHPSEVQHLVARALGRADAAVSVEVRRLGGGFGGKETQAALPACVAALLAARTGRPVKLRLDRDDDMALTGKRHDFVAEYEVGFDDRGRLLALDLTLASRCGMSADLSGAVNDRAMLHADNAYYLPHVTVTSHRCRTNTASNTAFRGFGGPQGILAIEQVIDEVARALGRDPLEVRRANLYGGRGRDVTPYGMRFTDNVLPALLDELCASSGYAARREAVARFNAVSPWLKRGLALTPVKFGIAFTAFSMNQAGALLHVYTDGSVHLNHGGVEMGQGLFTKVAQVVADELGLPPELVRLMPTATEKVPNTSPTAASSGSDLNGAAALVAARTLRGRLAAVAATLLGGRAADVVFEGGRVRQGRRSASFAEVARAAHAARVGLSAAGFYRTPRLRYDRRRHRGRPFLYFSQGAAVAEVEVDTLTGEHRLLRVDLLHDCGGSLNPALDRGQVEGGFVQGMGWLTSEELVWDERGRLLTHAPSTYKIPACSDVPEDFRVTLRGRPNREPTVRRSKAVGEPPLPLAAAVFFALRDAVAAVGPPGLRPRLDAPATPERVLMAIEELRGRQAAPGRGEAG